MTIHEPGHLTELDRETCLHLLATQSVGRLALTDRSGPDVVPVNYALDGEDVLIATTTYGAIARTATGHRVAFEADHTDPATRSGWSVVVRGTAHPAKLFEPIAESPVAWADGPRSHVLRIRADVITGRQVAGPTADELPTEWQPRST